MGALKANCTEKDCAAGFAIGSPISPRDEYASDHIRALLGHRRYSIYYYYMCIGGKRGRKSVVKLVTIGRSVLRIFVFLPSKRISTLPGLQQNGMARICLDLFA